MLKYQGAGKDSVPVSSGKGNRMIKETSEAADRLFDAILKLETKEECAALFSDLCTVRELEDMAQRFVTAVMLSEGASYQQIADRVGISTATISRVKRCLDYGEDGYRRAIEKLKTGELTL